MKGFCCAHRVALVTRRYTISVLIQVQRGRRYREIAKELNISLGSIANTVKTTIKNGLLNIKMNDDCLNLVSM